MTDQELNEQVARKLEWTDIRDRSELGYGIKWTGKNPNKKDDFPEGVEDFDMLPDYCRSIEAAFEIMENWTTVGDYQFELHAYGQHSFGAGWANGSGWLARAEADTAPRAIVEAFLKLPEDGK